MKKSTKGAVAASAAAVLLLGGAGSLAYWNDSANIDGGTISSGRLELTATDIGTWTLNGAAVPDISAVELVPGDELDFTGSYDILAEGDNLQANVAVDGAQISGDLASKLTTTVTTTREGAPIGPITEDNNGDSIDVVASFDFPFGTQVDNSSQNLTADLSDATITLTQTDATP